MFKGILLIVIDCLRADHVSCYEYDRVTTPTIDALAERGHLWEKAYSVACWTRPSIASIFTGLYPTQHGAFEYIKGHGVTGTATTDVLRSTQPTLAETLSSHGWRCGAFMRNEQLGAYTGLNRGFETYVSDAGKAPELLRKYEDWLRQDLEAPSFGYLHLLEAHWPYRAKERHLRMFGGTKATNHFREFTGVQYAHLKRALSVAEESLSPIQLEQMVQLFDACVRRADEALGNLLETLEALGIRDEMAIIVTADHGEEFLDHGGIGHGQGLFDELIHVPMVMSVPGRPGPMRYPHPVSQVDLAEAVLDLAGIHSGSNERGFFTATDPDRPIFAERRKRKRYTHIIRKGQWKYHRHYKFKMPNGDLDKPQTTHEMLNKYRHKMTDELYDLGQDPRELHNLVGDPQCAHIRERLAHELDAWWRQMNDSLQHNQVEDVEMDPRIVERLRDLGYIE